MRHTSIFAVAAPLMALLTACHAATNVGPNWTEANYSSGWGPCPSDRTCFNNWHVNRGTKTLLQTGSSGQTSRTLNDQEWSQLEKLIAQARLAASQCPSPPTDVFDGLEIIYSNQSKFSKSVTGCAYAQDANSVKALKEWLSK